jgi:hypothetical protein
MVVACAVMPRPSQERQLAAGVTTVLREGEQVPVAAIAAEAGVGRPSTGATPPVRPGRAP